LQSGWPIFPSFLKQALVFPRLKKSTLDLDDLYSYLPISDLPYESKLVERAVAKWSSAHAATDDLAPSEQTAYRRFHSVETVLLSVHCDLVLIVDRGKVATLVMLDLSAAFDTADFLSVLRKRFSVTDTVLDWFTSYLSDRSQSFVVSSHRTPIFLCTHMQCSPRLRPRTAGVCSLYKEDIVDLCVHFGVDSRLYADHIHSCTPLPHLPLLQKLRRLKFRPAPNT
jgi:Reverse transcriptase (RNA-dependent DNA polymerase)